MGVPLNLVRWDTEQRRPQRVVTPNPGFRLRKDWPFHMTEAFRGFGPALLHPEGEIPRGETNCVFHTPTDDIRKRIADRESLDRPTIVRAVA